MRLSHIASAIAVLATAAIAQPSVAQSRDDTVGLYGGINLGQSRATVDDDRIGKSFVSNGFAVNSLADDNRSTGLKLFGGYQFNKNLALEGGVFSLGKFSYHAATTPIGTLDGQAKFRGLNLDVVGTLPLTGGLSVFGRAGLTYAEARDRFSSTGAVVVNNPNPTERAANWKAGVGLQYAFTPALSVRVELERYRVNDAVGNKGDVDMASVGFVYRFGAAPGAASRAAAPPPMMASTRARPCFAAAAAAPDCR